MLKTPYLLFLGDVPDPLSAKVAQGIRDWRPEYALGQLRLPGCQADMKLPDLSIEEAVAQGARTLVIGAANRGGVISRSWIAVLKQALAAGMDIASGLHNLLRDEPELVEAAKQHGGSLFDVRVPQVQYPIGDGKPRRGKRCLAVGTDCSIGKMYTALALDVAMRESGAKSTFRATGQTGILITGEGVPLDAVVADFMAGAVEWLTPDNDDDHWDIIEGQGSLFHPSYSGVTMALIHGGQPDALILCHEPTRTHMRGLPHYQLPTLEQLRDIALPLARVVNPACQVVGVSVNTSGMPAEEAERYLEQLEARLALPCVDPYRQGAQRLAEAVLAC
ncbi:N-acetyltransferase DgcN [Salinicola peritrichatus]|uniref:N-acetyltransferase DgcN n=1 Tax=Salinicola peritrichatus TaxID=1267424 RepID=UPI000DA249D0|nr:N-acetyltransferase DgcN [Salinicola peritrichatus]